MRGLVSLSGLGVCLIILSSPARATPPDAPPPSGTATATATANPTDLACVGNCNADAVVTVNELIIGVNIALGNAAVSSCPAFDQNHDGMVAVNELIAGVSNLLYGCGVVPPTATVTATPSPSLTPTASSTPPPADTLTATPAATPSVTPTRTRAPTNTKTVTPTPTVVISVCGGPVSTLPVVCNLTVIPNPVSRSGTIAFRFGISDLDGDIDLVCIQLTYPPLEPQTTCTQFTPTARLINAVETTEPVAASPLQFGTYQAAVRAFDAAGNKSNVITATFQVQ